MAIIKDNKTSHRIIPDSEANNTKVQLQTTNGVNYGEVSQSAYSAIRGGYLDKYKPQDDNEKKVLENFKKKAGILVSYDKIKQSYDNNKFGLGNIDLTTRPVYTNADGKISIPYIVLKGSLKIQIGSHSVVLNEGDSVYFDSSTPHGMIAVGGQDCEFYAIVLQGQEKILHSEAKKIKKTKFKPHQEYKRVYHNFIETTEDEKGALVSIDFKNENNFNFALFC